MTGFKRALGAATVLAITLCASMCLAGALAAEAKTGDLHRGYTFAPTGEAMGYRLYVPPSYDPAKPMALVVVLHGSGADENSLMDRPSGAAFRQLADKHRFILLFPRGYNAFGGYGDIYPVVVTRETAIEGASFSKRAAGAMPPPPSGPRPPPSKVAVPADDFTEQSQAELTDARISQLSEQEVFTALADVRKNYNIDASRIYLTGNSMGGIGTEYLAAKYPTLWAAVAPGGGPVAAWSYPFERLRDNKVPILFVHGELDEHANPHWSQVLADAAKVQGVDARFLLIEGGHHVDAWSEALPQILDFFDAHHR